MEKVKKLSKGDRVQLTELGVKQGWGKESNLGTVTRKPRGLMVSVRRDGNKSATYWHENFWDKVKD